MLGHHRGLVVIVTVDATNLAAISVNEVTVRAAIGLMSRPGPDRIEGPMIRPRLFRNPVRMTLKAARWSISILQHRGMRAIGPFLCMFMAVNAGKLLERIEVPVAFIAGNALVLSRVDRKIRLMAFVIRGVDPPYILRQLVAFTGQPASCDNDQRAIKL